MNRKIGRSWVWRVSQRRPNSQSQVKVRGVRGRVRRGSRCKTPEARRDPTLSLYGDWPPCLYTSYCVQRSRRSGRLNRGIFRGRFYRWSGSCGCGRGGMLSFSFQRFGWGSFSVRQSSRAVAAALAPGQDMVQSIRQAELHACCLLELASRPYLTVASVGFRWLQRKGVIGQCRVAGEGNSVLLSRLRGERDLEVREREFPGVTTANEMKFDGRENRLIEIYRWWDERRKTRC